MTVIAVAGGAGKLGRAIVDALLARGKHTVFVLSRQASEAKEKEIGARILAAPYDNVDALTSLLEDNKIELVISTLDLSQSQDPEVNLIQAADKSAVTRRFIPSSWAIKYTPEVAKIFPLSNSKLAVFKIIEGTSLEWTAVTNGFFADYFFAPKVPSYQPPMAVVIDIAHNTAAVPGSGDVPVVFTHTWDIAQFVAALVDVPKWERDSYIIGDRLTWNEFVRLAEEAKGVKFTVTTDDLETLRAGRITELPSHPSVYPWLPKPVLQSFFASFSLMFEEGVFNFRPERTLNDEFPEIKARTIKELLETAWKE
ncbi:hypothetical protein VTJ83DRAFT_5349 [Remersonia thermophila]|uniref:NmrA-like domain-containing protein n=1 Tax=Remersonia thermophila TaxID=72144 RepID=A0ABR4D8S7_9PEZI